MLSRVANSLYWMSRYLERAENTARLVDVNLQLLLDYHGLNDEMLADYWSPIIKAVGDEELFLSLHKQSTGEAVTEFLVFQAENPNSISGSVSQARENARMVRDQVTIEVWEELNRLYLFLKSEQARQMLRGNPFGFFQEIRSSSLLLQGLTDAIVAHNEGWQFIQVGKFLERADKTSRILDVMHESLPERGVPSHASQIDALKWSAVLRSCSAWDVYQAMHGSEIQPVLVAELLLLSEDFPRSARFCAQQLNTALRRISGVSEGRFSNDAEKRAGRLLAELQFSSVTDFFDLGFHNSIDMLQAKFNAIGDALFQVYILHAFQDSEENRLRQQEEQQQQGRSLA